MNNIEMEFNSDSILIIGDAHAGVRDGNHIMMNHQLEYLENEVIPMVKQKGIELIIQTGDIFDVRKFTNTEVLSQWKKRFFDVLEQNDIKLLTFVGNHDMFYKNKITPNSITENLSQYKNIVIVEEPTEVSINKEKMLFIPWICTENEQYCMDAIRNSNARGCFGHFEVKGARMESGVCTDGLPLSVFNRYEVCVSGHFHTKGKYENMQYVGVPYQMSWGDYGDDKGVWEFNVKTLDLEFIRNENEVFHRITYNEDKDMSLLVDGVSFENQYVKVIVEHREDFKKYESWLMKLENSGVQQLSVVEPFEDRSHEDSFVEVTEDSFDKISTEGLIKEYIEDVYPEKKEPLTKLMLGLLGEAQRIYG